MDWEAMPSIATSDSGSEIKFCSGCDKEVYESVDDDELIDNITLNRCVLIYRPTESGTTQLIGDVTLPEKLRII